MLEQEWKLNVSSDSINQNAEVLGMPHAPTIVPVRTQPFANYVINDDPGFIEPDEAPTYMAHPKNLWAFLGSGRSPN
jgi:hypothetical protein